MTLAEKVVALHRALAAAGVPHAIGGALALAFWTLDPRGTSDIDVNVFVGIEEVDRVLAALPEGVAQPRGTKERLVRDEQIRLWWEDTPVDLFFAYAPVHADAAAHRRTVEFAGAEIPILGAVELALFKAMFDRPRDWGDIAEMARAGKLDVAAVRTALVRMLGPDDPRLARLDEIAGG